MTDLRELDARFATEVCGFVYSGGAEPYWFDQANNKKHDATFWAPTRSLDDAWAGVEKVDADNGYVGFHKSPAGHWMCSLSAVGVDQESHGEHPAEALVRALLNAVEK